MNKMSLLLLVFIAILAQSCTKKAGTQISSDDILIYSTQSIAEENSNDGTIDATISITLSGVATFNSPLVDGVDFDFIDLPDGLDATLVRESDTEATLTIAGMATEHSFCDDSTMRFFFNPSAFSTDILPISFDIPITISWISPALEFSIDEIEEAGANDGSIDDTITITATGGGQFLHSGGATAFGTPLTQDVDFTWDLPDGITPLLSPDAVDPDTVINVTFVGSADSSSPISDVTTELKFAIGTGVISDFCAAKVKKNIDLTFQRTVVMYSVGVNSGNVGGQTDADALCFVNRPDLPEDYTDFISYVSFDAVNDIEAISVPDDPEVESTNGTVIGVGLADLLDGTILISLSDADVVTTPYWTGSDADGSLAGADNCLGFNSSDSGDTGAVGDPDATDGTWLNNAAPQTCDTGDTSILCIAFPG